MILKSNQMTSGDSSLPSLTWVTWPVHFLPALFQSESMILVWTLKLLLSIIMLDQQLTFAPHLHCLSRDCYLTTLRQLHNVARSLTTSPFITILFDNCSILITELTASRLFCLDLVGLHGHPIYP